MEHDSSLRNRSLTFDCGGSRIADSLHTRNFLRLPSLWGRLCVPLIHSDSRHLSVLRVESRLSRSSVLSIHSSQAFCISPSSWHIHTHRSSHSPSVPPYLPPCAPSLSLSLSYTLFIPSSLSSFISPLPFALHPRYISSQPSLIRSLFVYLSDERGSEFLNLPFPSSIGKWCEQRRGGSWRVIAISVCLSRQTFWYYSRRRHSVEIGFSCELARVVTRPWNYLTLEEIRERNVFPYKILPTNIFRNDYSYNNVVERNWIKN